MELLIPERPHKLFVFLSIVSMQTSPLPAILAIVAMVK
jgi:hypothetical protein